jgi:hypothetical protein
MLAAQPRDIDYIRVAEPAPVVLAYGIGVDSTALLVELESRGTPPDLVLTGDPGVEKPETYAYQQMPAATISIRAMSRSRARATRYSSISADRPSMAATFATMGRAVGTAGAEGRHETGSNDRLSRRL